MYKCIKGFLLDMVDGDGFTIKENGFEVEKGTIWKMDKHSSRVIGGQIRLISTEESFDWIEIDVATLRDNFRSIN